MDHELETVLKNISGEPGTFIYMLHEECLFDADLFQAYYDSMCNTSTANSDTAMLLKTIETNTFVLRCLIYHFLPDDLYEITNLPYDISDYVQKIDAANERLIRLIIDGAR